LEGQNERDEEIEQNSYLSHMKNDIRALAKKWLHFAIYHEKEKTYTYATCRSPFWLSAHQWQDAK